MRKTKIDIDRKTVLITGIAGFIGSALALKMLQEYSNVHVAGIDNMNDYYDVSLKQWRLKQVVEAAEKKRGNSFQFIHGDIADRETIFELFAKEKPSVVIHLAAQAGVRYSIENPDIYIQSNMVGFYHILEACRASYLNYDGGVQHLVFASSSSVYGSSEKTPYSIEDKADEPISLYAATKKSNEVLAHAYAKLYEIPSTGLRFFTAYGPAGRPDMAYFKFVDKLLKGETIQIFNYGECYRDFTYIDDIVSGILRVMECAPERKKGKDGLPIPPYCLYNIGNGHPEKLSDFVEILQKELVQEGLLPQDYDFEKHREFVEMQPGDVPITYADMKNFESDFGFRPQVKLKEGLHFFVKWYKAFYGNECERGVWKG